MVKNDELLILIGQLPEELQEEGSTGRDLIDSIICEASKQERERMIKWLEGHWFGHTCKNVRGQDVTYRTLLEHDWQTLKGE